MEMCSSIADQVNAAEQKIKASSSSDQDAIAKRLSEEADVGDMLSNLQSMPAILDAKDRLGKHSRILTAVKNAIADRHITYEWFTPQMEKQTLMGMIVDDKLGVVDRWRLVTVYLLTAAPSSEETKEVIAALKAAIERHAAHVAESVGMDGVVPDSIRNLSAANDFGTVKVS
jgi:nucleotide-binding universal stress UspA family protein